MARRARGRARLPVPRHRPERARPPVHRRAVDRATRGRATGRRPLVAILLDPSAIVAAADTADLNHRAATAWFAAADEPLLLGALGLGELDLLLQRELGAGATEAVLQALVSGALRLVPPAPDDPSRALGLIRDASE